MDEIPAQVIDPADPDGPPAEELTIERALLLAVQFLQNGHVERAGKILDVLVEEIPDFAAALHFSGVVQHKTGHSDEALARIERSLELDPGVADWHNNHGIVLQEVARLEDAIRAYQRAIALDPGHVNAHSNTGALLRALGRPKEAEQAYHTAIQLDAGHAASWSNLGLLLRSLGRGEEAVQCFCRAITLRPKSPDARRLLALAHCTLGEVDKAREIFEDWLREEPNNAIAAHMLAACNGGEIPARASDTFVSQTFDSFAASFEARLESLAYQAPALVAERVERSGPPAAGTLDILDAGCGTGLCGPLVVAHARRLVGIDLSTGMLQRARLKQVYHALHQVELTLYLQDNPGAFDVIISADTLCYFGPLEPVLAAANAALRPGGRIVFTVEWTGDDSGPDYRLETHGRYTHAQPYVERVLREAGFTPSMDRAQLRVEAALPVTGLVVLGVKD